MNREVRRKLEMAVRVREFFAVHLPADASIAAVLDRLNKAINRMEALIEQQVGGFLSKRSSVVRRRDIRRRLHGGILRHLVTIAGSAGEEKPVLRETFRLPSHNATHKLFRAVAHKMLEQGQAEKELLVKHGLSETLLDDLSAAIAEFDASVAETTGGTMDHVLARAELEMLSDEVMQVVGMLDGINRYRFERDPQLLVAWKSAKRVVSGPQVEAPVVPEPGPAAGEPVGGEVKPAA